VSDVVIYTRPWCGYCKRAKALLERKGVAYAEIDVEARPEREREMVSRAGGRTTVPQIFIGGVHVGGSDDLRALEHDGRLDPLLGRVEEEKDRGDS
jgi:glutaredoxin 3